VIGGGLGTFTETLRSELAASNEYVLVERSAGTDGSVALAEAASLAATEQRKLFGLFGNADDRWATPLPQHSPGAPSFDSENEDPTLAAATQAALEVLASDPDGFFVMIEGGDIDLCDHSHDLRCMIGAMARFDAAVRAAVDYVDSASNLSWNDTLLLVTSDHGNGYLRLNPEQPLGQGELPESLDSCMTYGVSGHTNELVTLAARGAGTEQIAALPSWYGIDGILDNTQIYSIMRGAAESEAASHIILMIGDGMDVSDEVATSRYLYGTDDGLRWHQSDFDVQARVATWNIDTYNRYACALRTLPYREDAFEPRVGYDPDRGGSEPQVESVSDDPRAGYFLTELAGYRLTQETGIPEPEPFAAATALATGHKTEPGHISQQPASWGGRRWLTLAQQLKRDKRGACGVVTSAPLGASPAAAYVSHAASTDVAAQLVDEMVFQTRPEVLVGGGHPDFVGSHAYVTEASMRELEQSPFWRLAQRETGRQGGPALVEAAAQTGSRLFGLYGGGDGWLDASEENPSLAEATEAALTVLSGNEQVFLLVVDQPEVDRASRKGQLERVVEALGGLDAAVRATMDFVEREGDDVDWDNTLILVTATCATGHPTIDVAGERGELPAVTWGASRPTNDLVTVSAMGGGLTADYPGPFAIYEGRVNPGLRLLDNTQLFSVVRDFLGLDEG
jgi:alkaline phosphatase